MPWRRRPKIAKLARKNDVKRLVAALDYRDHVVDRYGREYDLGTHVRRDAALALSTANRNGIDVGPPLAKSLGDSAGEVRRAAAAALGARREARAATALLEAAFTWSEPQYAAAREVATEALIELSSPERVVVNYVVQRQLDHDRVEDVIRRMTARGGEETARQACAAAAAALVRGDREKAVRAADVFAWLGSHSVEPLLMMLSETGHARLSAISALGRIRDLRASEPLLALLHDDDDPEVRTAAATALGEIADPATTQPLVSACADPDHSVRAATLEALQKLGPLAVMPGLTN